VTIWESVDGAATEPRTGPAAITIGNFDGVHRGHQHLLDVARDIGGPVVAVTFDPHPAELFAPDRAPKRLTTLPRRIELLKQHGADEVRVLAFTRDMAALPAAEFIQRVLVDELHASAVVVGENFRFGSKAAGDVDLLQAELERLGCQVRGVVLADAGNLDGRPFCSTLVRDLVAAGQVAEAAVVLGRPHEVEGKVKRGDGRGKGLGFPTANVPVDDRIAVPADGVYAGWLVAEGMRHPAAISVGTNPTFGESPRRVESYLLDMGDVDLYEATVRAEFVEHLRPMEQFDTVEALVAQMHDDVSATRSVLSATPR
jgi:riboflavin kinase/FMN adenylyltransferase